MKTTIPYLLLTLGLLYCAHPATAQPVVNFTQPTNGQSIVTFAGLAGTAQEIARILFVIFIVFFLVSLISRNARR